MNAPYIPACLKRSAAASSAIRHLKQARKALRNSWADQDFGLQIVALDALVEDIEAETAEDNALIAGRF